MRNLFDLLRRPFTQGGGLHSSALQTIRSTEDLQGLPRKYLGREVRVLAFERKGDKWVEVLRVSGEIFGSEPKHEIRVSFTAANGVGYTFPLHKCAEKIAKHAAIIQILPKKK